MAYFQDLSKCEYMSGSAGTIGVNVGWLSKEHHFEVGRISDSLIDKLKELAKTPVNLTRGYHYCEICDPPIFSPRGDDFVSTLIKDAPKGNGEIRVPGSSGKEYVAPILIVHYIEAHCYMPPDEFLNALQNA